MSRWAMFCGCATSTETEQVGVKTVQTARTGVEENSKADGDRGPPCGREIAEEWAVLALEESEEDENSEDEVAR